MAFSRISKYIALNVALGLGAFGVRCARHRHAQIRLRQQNPFENSLELPMALVSGYLLGRSITCWIRARSTMHDDLHE